MREQKYTKDEIITASRMAYIDIAEGKKSFLTEHKEVKNVQSGSWNPYEIIQETRKYKLTIEFLEKHEYLKK